MSPDAPDRRPRLLTLAHLAWTGVGLFVFIYFVRRAGLSELTSGIRNVGWGFLVIVLLGGLRFAARTLAWQRCIEGQPRPSFTALLRGTIAGDATGHLTPLGLFVSEPAKALYVAQEVPLIRALSALAVENFFYALSAFLVISAGLLFLPLAVRTPASWSTISAVIITILLGLAGLVHLVLSRRVMTMSRCAAILDRIRGRRTGHDTIADRIAVLETKTFNLYNRSRRHLASLALLELGFHTAGVAELYLTLALLTGEQPTLLVAFLFESLNRFVNAAFKFVPMRLGVDEAGTAMFASLLQFTTSTGVTLAIVRKARIVVWVAIGAMLLARRRAWTDLRARST